MTHDARILDLNRRHFGGRMDHRSALILASSLLCGSAFAGYAQLAPPSGYSSGGGGASYQYPSASNAASYANGTVRTNAALNVGGKAVQVPASMRIAANAGRIAAAAIYLHPGLRTAAAVAGWLGVAGLVYDVGTGLWQRIDPDAHVSSGKEYNGNFAPAVWGRGEAICAALGGSGTIALSNVLASFDGTGGCNWSGERDGKLIQGNYSLNIRQSSCPSGWYQTPAGCVQTPPMKTVTKEEFEQMVPDARPMPPELPGVVWPAKWPVEVPEIQPMFVPTGNPVPNPKYDPSAAPSPENQPFVQPGVKVTPAPTPSSPWQVDLQPVNRPTDSPTPKPDPVQDPLPNPDGSGNNDKPRDPEKDSQDLCEKYPDILACQKLDEPEDPGKLKVQEVDFNFQPESGFAGSASCPAPTTVKNLTISWQPFCNSLGMIRPFLLAMAWLSAAFIMLGARRE